MADYEKRRLMLLGAVILILVVAGYKLHPRSTFAADGLSPRWDATVEQSRETHRPSLVLFTADWCPSCRDLDGHALSRPDIVQEINDHYTMIAVDLSSPDATTSARQRRYGVSVIPTLIRFDADGKETDRTNNIPPDQLLAWLRAGE